MSPNISISEVAERAGVSVTTVSHTLSGRRPVSDKTRERVMAAVADLGYRPNRLAGSLRTQRTHTIALVIPDITNPFYPEVARGLQSIVAPHRYQVFICSTDGAEQVESDFLSDVVDRRVDGIVFAPVGVNTTAIKSAVDAEICVVLLSAVAASDLRKRMPQVDLVHSDDQRGVADSTRYLIEQGHRRIGFINATRGTGPADRRLAGYRLAMAEAGLETPVELVVSTAFTRSGGAEGMATLMDLHRRPTAVLCANDLIAIGALDVAAQRQLAVPGDVAVIGYDDIEAASLVSPALTTVLNPAREIGQVCGRLLLDRMSGEYTSTAREVVIANELIRRASA
jgi:DNA-binding LacI/PurR family transcriptional regulator